MTFNGKERMGFMKLLICLTVFTLALPVFAEDSNKAINALCECQLWTEDATVVKNNDIFNKMIGQFGNSAYGISDALTQEELASCALDEWDKASDSCKEKAGQAQFRAQIDCETKHRGSGYVAMIAPGSCTLGLETIKK
jgi:hypothetical protein